jgi:hypothetical protein
MQAVAALGLRSLHRTARLVARWITRTHNLTLAPYDGSPLPCERSTQWGHVRTLADS